MERGGRKLYVDQALYIIRVCVCLISLRFFSEPWSRFGGGIFSIGATSIDLEQGTRLTNCTAYLRGGGLYYDDAQKLYGKGIECRCRQLTVGITCQSLVSGELREKKAIVIIATTASRHCHCHHGGHLVAIFAEPHFFFDFQTLSFGYHRVVLVIHHLLYPLHRRTNQAKTLQSSRTILHSSLQHFSSTAERRELRLTILHSLFPWMET